jgi:endonuclease/exonuclease/phosphatase family metal-dependent hydrolase
MSDTITVITYNIHHGAGVDQKLDLERIAKVIKRENPDIVAFQEVDVMANRTGNIDEPKILGELTGYKPFFGKAVPIRGGEYGNAIITRDKDAVVVEHLPLPGNEPRCMIAVQTKSSKGTPYVLACTHLALEEENCMKSTEIIGDWVKSLKVPSLLVGDMNCTTGSQIYNSFTKTWEGTWGNKPLPTFPARNPKKDIDHCFTYPKQAWEVIDITVVEEPLASDHRPLKVTLALK